MCFPTCICCCFPTCIPPSPVFRSLCLRRPPPSPPLLPGVFALNETTGVISTARPLDYEANSSFILKVEADSMRVASSNFRAPSKSECTAPFRNIRHRNTAGNMVQLRTSPVSTSLSLRLTKYYSLNPQSPQASALAVVHNDYRSSRKTYSYIWDIGYSVLDVPIYGGGKSLRHWVINNVDKNIKVTFN